MYDLQEYTNGAAMCPKCGNFAAEVRLCSATTGNNCLKGDTTTHKSYIEVLHVTCSCGWFTTFKPKDAQ